MIEGKLKTIPAQPDDPDLVKFMSWVDPVRKLRVRANADIPRDAKQARLFGAEGIGLCRTEHMFFAEDRIEHMRAMILADNEKERRDALKKLLPMQRADFVGLFKAMESLPVTIRLLDPPLHEFLPKREDLLVEIQHLEDTKPRSPKLKELRIAAGPRGGTARGEPHARPARLPSRHRVPRDHRDAGARHLRGRGQRQESRAAIRTSRS